MQDRLTARFPAAGNKPTEIRSYFFKDRMIWLTAQKHSTAGGIPANLIIFGVRASTGVTP
ncbi:hypothetical protein [Shinella zoogloeoides]|uniref:hypothetical protein n=1 Tax=Shinella zoogloeoides TaxID=352475 RepID=UPI00299F16F1|nr:hypothetical protein [Shinella zoogloeoides]